MAKLKVEWSINAVNELTDILDFYSQRNLSNQYSKKLFSRLMKYVEILSENPMLGIKTDEQNVRTLIIDNYQIIYEIKDDLILVSMIWDSRRNPEHKFSTTKISHFKP